MLEWLVSLPGRLDTFLAAAKAFESRAKAQAAIEAQAVMVNGEVVTKAAYRLQEGDRVCVTVTEATGESPMRPVDLYLSILYEDAACAIIDKPAGLAVHPGAGMAPGEPTILHGAVFLYAQWGLPFSSPSVLVHRLDRETTGCLLIAKHPSAHLFLQKQFEERTITKAYLALVAGVPAFPTAKIEAPIGRSTRDRTMMGVTGVSRSREAQTTYRIIASTSKNALTNQRINRQEEEQHEPSVALLECALHTGRTHQIRVHLSSIGHPVLGDGTYGSPLSERLNQEYDIATLCLHAWKLRFVSPADGTDHEVVAPLPAAFREVLRRMGIDWQD